MEINEVRERIAKLETDIFNAVEGLIAKFNEATGEGVRSVDIRMASVHKIAEEKPRFIVADVNVTVDL